MPYKSLYCNSYVDISTTINDFCKESIDYLDYVKLERLQSVSEKIGLCSVHVEEIQFDDMIELANENFLNNRPLFIEVDFYKLNFARNIVPRQNRHGLLLYKIHDGFVNLLDDYPIQAHYLDLDKLRDIYLGRTMVFCERSLNLITYGYECKTVLDSVKAHKCQQLKVDFEHTHLLNIRDSLGIIRISRSRIKDWLKWINDENIIYIKDACFDLLSKQIYQLNKLFSLVEYCRIRKRDVSNDLLGMIEEINELDDKWRNEIQ